MKKITQHLFSFLWPIILVGIFNAMFFLPAKLSLIREIYVGFFITIFPGYLLLTTLFTAIKSFWEKLFCSVGLSIAYLMLGGLLLNSTLPLWGIKDPLNTPYLVYFITFTVISCSLVRAIWKKHDHKPVVNNISLQNIGFMVFPPSLILLSILGALSLNNGGNNSLTILMLSLAALSIIGITFIKKVKDYQFAWLLYCISLSLLFMLSLRSSYLVGWDIHTEFTMFQLTSRLNFWDIEALRNAYNACLSITILPTVIANLTNFSDVFVYKVYYQFIFALFPLVVFFLLRKYTAAIIAFLSLVYLISQPLFIQPMTGLMRQEISLFFFVLLLYVTFKKDMNITQKLLLQISFGSAMVVSHYSTTYIALLLIFGNYALSTLQRVGVFFCHLFKKIKKQQIEQSSTKYKPNLSFVFVLFIALFTTFWYGFYTQTANNLIQVVNNVTENNKDLFKTESKSEEAKASLSVFSKPKISFSEEVKKYIEKKDALFEGYKVERYTKQEYENYPISEYKQKSLTPILSTSFNLYIIQGLQLLKTISKLLIVVGVLFLIGLKSKRTYDIEFIYFIFLSLLLVAGILIHPTLSLSYNVSRLLIQVLIFLSVTAVIGGISLIFFSTDRIKNILFATFLSLVFLSHTGYFSQLLGGSPFLHLNNIGNDYDKFYIHDSEVSSAKWLGSNRSFKDSVFSDDTSSLRLKYVLNMNSNQVIIPSLIYRNSYVYARYANIVEGRAETNYEGKELILNFPREFLEDNKDLIYSNGKSNIYR